MRNLKDVKLLEVYKLEIAHFVIADWRQFIANNLLFFISFLIVVVIDHLKFGIYAFLGLVNFSH